MKEFAFDVSLKAVCRVKAATEGEARDAMQSVLDCVEPDEHFLKGWNDVNKGEVEITEFSLDQKQPCLFEIDGKPAKSGLPDACRHGDTAGGICLDCGHDTVEEG